MRSLGDGIISDGVWKLWSLLPCNSRPLLDAVLLQYCSESCRSVVETFQLDVGSVDAVAARVGKVVRKNLGFLGFKTFYKP